MHFFICEFVEESNSFNPKLTDIELFRSFGMYEGTALLEAGIRAGATINGMLDAVRESGHTAVGGIRMHTGSGGPVEHAVVEHFLSKTFAELEKTDTPDAVLISLHGATVSDISEDVCGDILEAVRSKVGETCIIAATCDLHGNITQKIGRYCDILCGYQTYPHLDQYETGHRAARLAIDMASGKHYKTVCVRLPMMAPAHGYTTASGSLHTLMQKGHTLVADGKIADFSIFQVQPWMDIKEISSTVVIVAEDTDAARNYAAEMAREEWALRKELLGTPLHTIEQVIQSALTNTVDAPVILVDSADSPNAGAVGDCADVIEKLLPYKDRLHIAVSVIDAPAVEKAFSLGVGGRGEFTLGATVAPKLSRPVTVTDCTVKSLHCGNIILEGPAERYRRRNLGRCAVLVTGGMQILVTTGAHNNGDKQFYRGFGIEPTLCDLVCIKACTSFRAGYEPISAEILNTATPGAADPELTKLPFERLPQPFFPFQEITKEQITKPIVFRGKESK